MLIEHWYLRPYLGPCIHLVHNQTQPSPEEQCLTEEGRHGVTSQQQLVHSDNIPRIVDANKQTAEIAQWAHIELNSQNCLTVQARLASSQFDAN